MLPEFDFLSQSQFANGRLMVLRQNFAYRVVCPDRVQFLKGFGSFVFENLRLVILKQVNVNYTPSLLSTVVTTLHAVGWGEGPVNTIRVGVGHKTKILLFSVNKRCLNYICKECPKQTFSSVITDKSSNKHHTESIKYNSNTIKLFPLAISYWFRCEAKVFLGGIYTVSRW